MNIIFSVTELFILTCDIHVEIPANKKGMITVKVSLFRDGFTWL